MLDLLRSTAAVFILTVGVLTAEHLPIQSFSVAQGLPSNTIHRIVKDRHGFLWFCTGEGLSRFDGYAFFNLASLQGKSVWDFLETHSGDLFAATGAGLARFSHRDLSRVLFIRPLNETPDGGVLALKETANGTLWVGTVRGLYRADADGTRLQAVDTGPLPESWSEPAVAVLEEDGHGNLWFGGFAGIGRIRRDGHVDRWTPRHGFASFVVTSLLRDGDGTIWAGTETGLCHMLPDPRPGMQPAERCYGKQDGLPGLYTQSILRSRDGRLWAATLDGAAYALNRGGAPLRFTTVTRQNGLSDDNIEALAEDDAGNIWLGAADDGVMKVSREWSVSFTEVDGLDSPNVIAVFDAYGGRVCAITRSSRGIAVNRLEGTRFVSTRPAMPSSVASFGRGLQQVAVQDRVGRWWIGSGDGLLRYPHETNGGLRAQPSVFIRPGGPDGKNVFRVYQDSRGRIWWSTSSRISNTLGRWHPDTNAVEYFSDEAGLPPLRSNLPAPFVEDSVGTLWVGFDTRGIARLTPGGHFEYLDPSLGFPDGRMRTALADARHRLWFGSSTGLWRVDGPEGRKPVCRRYGRAEGLASESVHSLVEDRDGRIYVGTGVGVDRLDPESGRIEHLSAIDGLPPALIQAAHRDRAGNLWFATRHGVTRFTPGRAVAGGPPPRVTIVSCRVRGVERPVSVAEFGRARLRLKPNENQIEIGFTAPWFRPASELRYQFRLDGSGSAQWSSPSAARSVNYATLGPGEYCFLVRSVDVAGTASDPEILAFEIEPALWLTWWFRTTLAVVVAVILYAVYRYRIQIALEREHLRMRLAADLHDDIGSSLSSIAIWTDVATLHSRGLDDNLMRRLEQIGRAARDVVDSVSDMVWAVNPNNDRFGELGSRMRRYAGEMAVAADRTVTFSTAGNAGATPIGPALRREMFLVLKEALNNALRHSGATECAIELRYEAHAVSLTVRDNGKGFETAKCTNGNGLETMRRRANNLGGSLRLQSAPGRGSEVELRLPLRQRRSYLFRWCTRRQLSATLKGLDERRHN